MSKETNVIKRTREVSSPEDSEYEKHLIANSKRVIRSTAHATESDTEMVELKRMFKDMMTEQRRFGSELGDLKSMFKEIMVEIQKNNEEIKNLREEARNREQQWEVEKDQLYQRIDTLELKMDAQEKKKRKNNTIISGLTVEDNNLETNIEEFHKTNLEVEVKVKNAAKIRNQRNIPMYKVEWNSWEDKARVMQNKYKLKNKAERIYIENDLTINERQIQAELRNIAKTERVNNKSVKVGYRKITIDGTDYKWNPYIKGVVEVTHNVGESKN